MPRIIRYYLDEDAILPNVETLSAARKRGSTIPSTASSIWWSSRSANPAARPADRTQIDDGRARRFRAKLKADPANYISSR